MVAARAVAFGAYLFRGAVRGAALLAVVEAQPGFVGGLGALGQGSVRGGVQVGLALCAVGGDQGTHTAHRKAYKRNAHVYIHIKKGQNRRKQNRDAKKLFERRPFAKKRRMKQVQMRG